MVVARTRTAMAGIRWSSGWRRRASSSLPSSIADRAGTAAISRASRTPIGAAARPALGSQRAGGGKCPRLARIQTPLLILHGDRDPRVPAIESAQVAETMQRVGLAHEYVVYPGEGHGFRKREHRIDCYRRILDWFRRYLTV